MSAQPLPPLLDCWEAALRGASDGAALGRDEALLRFGLGEAPQGLSARNAGLLSLHQQLFGSSLDLRADCPACREGLVCTVDARACHAACGAGASDDGEQHLQAHGHTLRFRRPRVDDLAALASAPGLPAATQALLARCVLAAVDAQGRAVPAAALPLAVRQALSDALEALEPGATLWFALRCPACAWAWEAALDVGTVLWQRLQTQAERLLLEVDVLARRYGWTEAEVLALSPTRRAAYLQLAEHAGA